MDEILDSTREENQKEEVVRETKEEKEIKTTTIVEEHLWTKIPAKAQEKDGKVILTAKIGAEELKKRGIRKDDIVMAVYTETTEISESYRTEKKEPVFKAKYLIPLIVPIILLLGVGKACSKDVPEPIPDDIESDVGIEDTVPDEPDEPVEDIGINTEYERISLDFSVYFPDSPFNSLFAITAAKGQEGMTNNALENQNIFHGENYDCNQHFEDEKRASDGQEDFKKMEEQIKVYLSTLISTDASKQEKSDAVDELLKLYTEINNTFLINKEFAQEQTKAFQDNAEKHVDDNTKKEVLVVNDILAKYMFGMEDTNDSIVKLLQIQKLFEDGFDLEIGGRVDSKGVRITIDGIKAITGDVLAKDQQEAEAFLIKTAEKDMEAEKVAVER